MLSFSLLYECESVFVGDGLGLSWSLRFSSSRYQLRRLVLPVLIALLVLPLVLIIPYFLPHIDLLPPRTLRLPLPLPHDVLASAPQRDDIRRDGLDAPVLKRRIKLVLQHLREHQRDVLRVRRRRRAIAVAAAAAVKGVDDLGGQPASLVARGGPAPALFDGDAERGPVFQTRDHATREEDEG